MPWTAADAKSHKKGLTATQARAWAKIANQALRDCEAKGGSDCDGRAIRIANAAVDRVGKMAPDHDTTTVTMQATIAKSDDALQRVFGWVSVAVRKDGETIVDLQGDLLDIEDLAEAWYGYVAESGELDFAHDGPARGHLIEAMVFTPEKIAALGLPPDSVPLGCWAGYYVPDRDDYNVLKQQGFFMFSIAGEAVREEIG